MDWQMGLERDILLHYLGCWWVLVLVDEIHSVHGQLESPDVELIRYMYMDSEIPPLAWF